MSEPDREIEIVRYYENEELSQEKLQLLLTSGQFARSARRWRLLAAGAVIALIVSGVFGWRRHRDAVELADVVAYQDAQMMAMQRQREGKGSEIATTSEYRFVAFRSHGDRCPHCRATGEMYAQLKDDLKDQPIAFEQFELQKRDELQENLRRIDELTLTSLVEGKRETAFGVLLSDTGTQVVRIDPGDSPDAIRARVLDIIEQ